MVTKASKSAASALWTLGNILVLLSVAILVGTMLIGAVYIGVSALLYTKPVFDEELLTRIAGIFILLFMSGIAFMGLASLVGALSDRR